MGALILAHPVVPKAAAIDLADAPEISVELEMAPRLVTPRGAPARPRTAAAPPAEPAPAEKPSEPLIAPELTDEQLAAAKAETQKSLSAADRNLINVLGKTLNSAQLDAVSKIRGFEDSAREAIKANDWQRARAQAKKAEVLSQEFSQNP